MKEESEKVGLKLNIQKTKIMASGPIISWQIDGETVEKVSDFILGGSKITADGDYSHGIRRCLLLGRKVMTNLDSTSLFTCCLAVHISHQAFPGFFFLTSTVKQNEELRGTVGSGGVTPPMAAFSPLGLGMSI